jgi:hypothetical protein
MKTKMLNPVFFIAELMYVSLCTGQINGDINLADNVYHKLNKSAVANGITSTLGLASNIEMAMIGGFPLEAQVDLNPGIIVSHMCFSIGRWIFAIPPAILLSKASKELQPWRESREMAASGNKLFPYLKAAQVLTALAPVLSVSGGIMMVVASTQSEYTYNEYYGYHEQSKPNILKTAGWICVGAGLAASISGSVMIGLSKKELSRKIGTLKMSATPTGMGLIYSLPSPGSSR